MKKERLCRLLQDIMNNPGNVDFQKLKKVLEEFDFECRQSKCGSSHYIFRKNGIKKNISIPKKKPVGKVYIKNVIEILELEEWYEANCKILS